MYLAWQYDRRTVPCRKGRQHCFSWTPLLHSAVCLTSVRAAWKCHNFNLTLTILSFPYSLHPGNLFFCLFFSFLSTILLYRTAQCGSFLFFPWWWWVNSEAFTDRHPPVTISFVQEFHCSALILFSLRKPAESWVPGLTKVCFGVITADSSKAAMSIIG